MTAPKTISRKNRKAGQESSPDLAAVLPALPAALSVSQCQALASGTDLTARRGVRKLDFPLLSLFGEIGSLLSELKKKQRDTVSYSGYEKSVVEELGDVLWYFSNLATRAGITVSEMAQQVRDELDNVGKAGKQTGDIKFAALQPDLKPSGPGAQDAFEATLLRLAGEAGTLVADFSAGRINRNPKNQSYYWSVPEIA
jgi:NTP pyrophosphatase (non-canonical NTP hydrolase)